MADIGFVEQHNDLVMQINKAVAVEDMRPIVPSVKEFYTTYHNVDKYSTERLYEKCVNKIQNMIDDNGVTFSRITERLERINNSVYDFEGEKDDRQAVNNMVLQLISCLPKEQNAANAGKIADIIGQSTNSVIGSKAVLELMKIPAYADMVSESQKQRAFEGSKSESQKAFERIMEQERSIAEKARADVYLQGFHLRILQKQLNDIKKTSMWG